jgi:hypothetical protein
VDPLFALHQWKAVIHGSRDLIDLTERDARLSSDDWDSAGAAARDFCDRYIESPDPAVVIALILELDRTRR